MEPIIEQNKFNRGFPIRHTVDCDWTGAKSFKGHKNLSKVEFNIRKFGTPEFDLIVELRENGPEGTLLGTVTFTSAEVPSS